MGLSNASEADTHLREKMAGSARQVRYVARVGALNDRFIKRAGSSASGRIRVFAPRA